MADDTKDDVKDTPAANTGTVEKDTVLNTSTGKTEEVVRPGDPTDGTGKGSTPPGLKGTEGLDYPTAIDPFSEQAGQRLDPITHLPVDEDAANDEKVVEQEEKEKPDTSSKKGGR